LQLHLLVPSNHENAVILSEAEGPVVAVAFVFVVAFLSVIPEGNLLFQAPKARRYTSPGQRPGYASQQKPRAESPPYPID
jgi:hypothetical protein